MSKVKDRLDPYSLLEERIRKMRYRIGVLEGDRSRVQHHFSKAIIDTELERLQDDLIEKQLILSQRE